MKLINIKIKTKVGRWSAYCILLFALFFGIFHVVIYLGYRGGDTFFSNPPLAIPISLAGLSGTTAFVAGLIGIIKSKERSVFVFLSTLIGAFIFWFILGEVLTPH